MGERHLDVIALQVDDGVQRFAVDLGLQQVQQPVLALEPLPVEDDGKPRVQIAVVPQQPLDVLVAVLVLLEHGLVRLELDQGAVGGIGLLHLLVLHELAELEAGHLHLSVAHALHAEIAAERVHGLGTHPVQAHALLEGLAVVLGAGVDLADHVDHLAQGDAAAIVADAHPAVLDLDLHLAAVAHHVLVDAIVQHLLQQDVDAVVEAGSVAQLADVHARTEADVLLPVQGADMLLAVVDLAHGKGRKRAADGASGRLARRYRTPRGLRSGEKPRFSTIQGSF